MKLDAKVTSYRGPDEWRELAFEADKVPCDRCGCEPLPADMGYEVLTSDLKLHIICKRCADEVIA
jgi:ribosomal protein L37E